MRLRRTKHWRDVSTIPLRSCVLLPLLKFTNLYFYYYFSREYKLLFPCISLTAKNCVELYYSGQKISGVYTIDPDGLGAFNVYCDQTTSGGGWRVFQKRMAGSIDFNRTWNDYKCGFGNLVGEFWLGLDKINRLTQNKTKNMLRIDLGVTTRQTVHAEYGWFGIGNATADYRLYIGNMTGK